MRDIRSCIEIGFPSGPRSVHELERPAIGATVDAAGGSELFPPMSGNESYAAIAQASDQAY